MPATPSAPQASALGPRAAVSYLAPIENPKGFLMKLLYWLTRRQFGKVPRPFSVFCARMPSAFGRFYGKVSSLDKKLTLSSDVVILIRSAVHNVNMCEWCMDFTRWYVLNKAPHNAAKLDSLDAYRTSPLFSDKERVALDFAIELTRDKRVSPGTFAELARHHSEREICEIVWLVASEHLYNINNIGLGVGSDGLCAIAGGPKASALERVP
jgi:alkylhydroperoxidase family enzyme